LATPSPAFIPIVFNDEAGRELAGAIKSQHAIIVRPRNIIENRPTIALDLLRYEPFKNAMTVMGISDHLKIDEYARECGYSPTTLRRRLAKVPAIQAPEWVKEDAEVRRLIPMMLVGAWHIQSKGDCEIMHFLAGKRCEKSRKMWSIF
jgi:hypothetical protein